VTWEIDPSPGGSLLTVRQTGFLGVNGGLRRRELRRAYQEMFEERLPATLDRLARTSAPARLIAAGRAPVTRDVDNESPSAAPPPPNPERAASNLDDPSDPWALSDPLVTAGVALSLPDEALPDEAPPLGTLPRPDLAESPARRSPGHRAATSPSGERVRAAAITVTAALVVVTLGWLWLTWPNHEDTPPGFPQGADGPVAGGQPGLVLPSGMAPTAGFSAGSLPSSAPATSGAPVVPVHSAGTAPPSSAGPPPDVPGSQPLTASYGTQSSKGLLGYKVKVTVSVRNPGSQGHSRWTVVLTVPSGADLQGSASTVDARKAGDKVTITPKDGAIDGGATVVFDVTFGGGALLGIGSGGVTGCTVDGAACTRA
jgi:hypothetical protein